MNRIILIMTIVVLSMFGFGSARADVSSTAVRETAEFLIKRFGKEALEEGAEGLSRKIGSLAARFGDTALLAFRKVGPRLSGLVDDAGEHAPLAMRLLASHGDDAIRLVARPKQLGLVARFGDDAAEALLKHGEAAEPLIHGLGNPAAKALKGISTQNGRRISMLAADGELAKLGRSDELLAVISRYGDAGAEFVWKNKGALAVGAGLTAFLSTPETFINGGTELTSIVAESAIKPVAAAAAESTPWFAIASIAGLIGGLTVGWKLWEWHEQSRKKSQSSGAPAMSARDPHLS